jgi:hypothetical protein
VFKVRGSPARIPLFLLRDSAIVVGACVIGLQFDCPCVVSNCAILVVILRSSVAAVIVSSRVCGAQFDGSGVVGNGTGRVLLQPFGLGPVVLRGVILWIEFDCPFEIRDSPIQVSFLSFFDPAINEVSI